MNICIVMAGDEEGGLEKHVVELANGLVLSGHHVTLIAHQKYKGRVQGVDFNALDLSKSRRNPIVLWHLYKMIKSLNPEIIHVHGNKAAAMVGPLLPYLKVKSVATLHSRKKNTSMFKNFKAVIAVSPNAAEALVHANKFVVLNGIEKPTLDPSIKKIQPAVVLAVGRLVPVKGFDVLIQAWKGIEDAQLWIVANGFEDEKLRALITELDLSDSVQLLGHRNDVLQLMQQASIYIMSSLYEGCPYTMIEALLSKVPMLSTAVGAMTMVLPAQYLCPENDVDALHLLIKKGLSNLEQLEVDYQPSFEYAKKNLVIEGMLDQIINIYQQVLHS